MIFSRIKILAVLPLIAAGMAISLLAPQSPASAQTSTTQPQASAATDGCPGGFSCYYDGSDGNGKIWTAPSCGFFDLGKMNPPLNDRISSIINLGGGAVTALDWSGGSNPQWNQIGTPVAVGETRNYSGSWDNIIDAVRIDC